MNVSKTGLVAALVTAFVVIACGSDPKPDPNAATTSTPSATAPAMPSASAPAMSASAAAMPEAPKVDPKVAECDKVRDDANESLDAKRIEVDKDCKKDADCVGIKGRACGFDCVNGAIPKSLEKNWNEAVTKVKGDQCKKWESNSCSTVKGTKAPPTCSDKKVACEKNRCILK